MLTFTSFEHILILVRDHQSHNEHWKCCDCFRRPTNCIERKPFLS